MIELVFVIAILGILASVALPKLMGTRDDAKKTSVFADTRTCVNDIISSYKGRGITPDMNSIPSCVMALNEGADIVIDGDFVKVSNSELETLNGSFRMKGESVVY